jgi:hypothetical protein
MYGKVDVMTSKAQEEKHKAVNNDMGILNASLK